MKLKTLTYILLFASSVAAAENCVKPKNLPKHYEAQCVQANGLAVFEDTKKETAFNEGLMDAQGKIIASAQYLDIENDGKPYIKASKELMVENDTASSDVLMDTQGKEIIPLISKPLLAGQDIFILTERIVVSHRYNNQDTQAALFDMTGKQLTPFKYARIDEFHEGLARAFTPQTYKYGELMDDSRVGYINLQGEEVIPAIYKESWRFNGGVTMVLDEQNDYYLIDTKGNKLLKIPYEYQPQDYQYGYVKVTNDNREYALLDKTGKVVIPFGKLDNFYFHPSIPLLGIASDDNTIGLADFQGNILLEPAQRIFYETDDRNSVAFIEGNTLTYYDKQGRVLKSEPTQYAKECAHVKLDMPHKTKPSYRVIGWNSQENRVWVARATDKYHNETVTCSDIGTATPKGKR